MKKFLSMLLTLALTLSVCAVPAFAADDADTGEGTETTQEITPRDTNFFTPQPHTTLTLDEIQYQYTDPDGLLAEFAAVYEFAQDPSQFELFQERFISAKDVMYKMTAMYYLLSIETDRDTTNEWALEEYMKVYDDINEVYIGFNGLVRDVLRLDNACSDWLKSLLTDEDIEDYLGYEEPSAEELALDRRNEELEQEFEIVDHTTYTTTIDGVEYDADGVYDAFFDGTITLEQYLEGCRECYGPYGDLYLEMIDVRNQIAQLNGYANYAEYAYAEIYNRDYTVEDIEAFRTAVKTYLAPQLRAYRGYRPGVDVSEFPIDESQYTGEGMFDTLAPYFAQMSDELYESMSAVVNGGFYDITVRPEKANRGYSMMIPYYNMPFYYNYPYVDVQDLLTTIHELGHNNKSYWSPNDWTDVSPSSNKDLAEVHSQALELLMTHYYPELFGTQAEEMVAYETYGMLQSGIISGCLHDEIQCYAYSTPGVTFEMICQKYRQLAEEYGNVGSDDPRPEMYGWTSIHHTFNSPMYYISYATSAAGAFAFWNEAQDDFMPAVDHYLAFCAQPATCGFEETFANVGMESPLSPSYIKDLAKTVHDKLFYLDPFTDVYTDDWAVSYINWVTYYGMMDGVAEDSFAPAAAASRAVTMTAIARYAQLLGADDSSDELFTLDEGVAWAVAAEISDGTNPDGTLTREQVATMLCRFAELLGVDVTAEGDLSDFADAASVSDWAVDTLVWAVDNGLITGTGEGLLNPQGITTRAELATLLNRFLSVLY